MKGSDKEVLDAQARYVTERMLTIHDELNGIAATPRREVLQEAAREGYDMMTRLLTDVMKLRDEPEQGEQGDATPDPQQGEAE